MSRFKRRKRQQKKPRPLALVPDEAIVSICTPSDDHVHAMFCVSLLHMTMHTLVSDNTNVLGMTVQHVGGSILPQSRYTLVKKSLEQKATHLLFIDSDMSFPADTLIRLLRHDVDMVGVNAMSRRPPYQTTAWLAPERRAVTTKDSSGIEKAWRTGFAVVLIRARVFETLAPPYFDNEYIPERDQFRGEDYVFFDRAHAAGFELYIDHDLSREVNHIGSFAFNPVLADQKPPGGQEDE